MKCPHCQFQFKALASNSPVVPALAPLICEACAEISVLENGVPRIPKPDELASIKESPAWHAILEPVQRIIRDSKAPPPDRSKTTLSDGSPVTDDHRELKPDGQQKGYVVLSAEERRRGFVRPYRDTYTHQKCGSDTTMGRAIAETYARDPAFYGGTFCAWCRGHFPLTEFVWKGTNERVGS